MRLIDADYLMDRLRGNVLIDVIPELENAIQEQPTAYDVDKVVEQLEKRIAKAELLIVKPAQDKLDEIANDTAEAFIEAYKDAIEIIKAGGVNE